MAADTRTAYTTNSMDDSAAAVQIDTIIMANPNWKGVLLQKLRKIILDSDPGIYEEVKWKMPTRPLGLPVWSHHGIVCFAEIWKDNVKLLFPKGARLQDTNQLFNARLNSKDIRAIEYTTDSVIHESELTELVRQALRLNVAS